MKQNLKNLFKYNNFKQKKMLLLKAMITLKKCKNKNQSTIQRNILNQKKKEIKRKKLKILYNNYNNNKLK